MSSNVVRQAKLGLLMSLRKRVKDHIREAEKLGENAGRMEREVMAMLLADGTVEPGKWSAGMETKTGNCTPKWKDLYIEHMTMEHEVPAVEVEAKARALYPATQKTVLVVVAKTGDL